MEANTKNQEYFIDAVKTDRISVDEFGNVYSNRTGKEIGYTNKRGYKAIGLKEKGKVRHMLVHRLVYLLFVGELSGEDTINHKDTDKTNNHFSNLEPMSKGDNVKHAWEHNLYGNLIVKHQKRFNGERGSAAKLNRKDAEQIRKSYKEDQLSVNELASKYKVHRTTIYKVLKKKSHIYN